MVPDRSSFLDAPTANANVQGLNDLIPKAPMLSRSIPVAS
jgi:hypothetical protein